MFRFSHFIGSAAWAAAVTVLCSTTAQAANGEGQLDPSFNGTGKTAIHFDAGGNDTDFGKAVAVQTDGKIVVAGTIDVGNGETGIGLVRLLPDGSPDYGFGPDGTGRTTFHFPNTSASANAVAIQSDGRIVVAGSYEASGSDNSQILALRFSADGHQTSGFHLTDINDYDDTANGLAVAADGSIYLVGYTHYFYFSGPGDTDYVVVKLTRDLLPDTNFNGNGTKIIDFDQGGDNNDVANAIAIQPYDGHVIVVGTIDSGNNETEFGITRLNTMTGSLDTNFGQLSGYPGQSVVSFHASGTSCRDQAVAVKIAPVYLVGQVIYVAGTHCQFASSSSGAVAALGTTGSLLSFFGTGGTTLVDLNANYQNQELSELALQPAAKSFYSGVLGAKLLLAGTGTYLSSTTDRDMLTTRLGPDGSLDAGYGINGQQSTHFDYPNAGDDRATAAAMDGSGYLVIAGFTQRSASLDYDYAVARLLVGDRIYFDGFDN